MDQAIPDHIHRILDLARWAPSGDNTQPWRFEVLGATHFLVHGFDTRDHVVYDLDGHASQLAVGALLETIAIAASTVGQRANIERRLDSAETHLLFDIQLQPIEEILPNPLARFIEKRVVQRRPMSPRPLLPDAKLKLEQSLAPDFAVVWFEPLAERIGLGRFMFDNAKIRHSIQEAFSVHRNVIEWNARYSLDRIPDEAVGADFITLKLMRWAMANWERVCVLNKYLMGDFALRLQLDFLPSVFCAAHFAILARTPPTNVDHYLCAGRAVQRFWLTTAQMGLHLQPEMTPVIFSRYVRQQRAFTQLAKAATMARKLNERLGALLDNRQEQLVFMGRIGYGKPPWARSLRKPLDVLMFR
jgi:hypothetical protein